MNADYFQKNLQEVNMKSEKNRQVIYPKIFKLETGRDLLNSLQEMAKKENKAGYILSVVGIYLMPELNAQDKNNQL